LSEVGKTENSTRSPLRSVTAADVTETGNAAIRRTGGARCIAGLPIECLIIAVVLTLAILA
jgi:hypothetical protein